jgi:bifunctional DNA-binding transcriptional regulator/antitoxin component of YhaV-PrlF toxin-antitoxin module
MTRDLFAGKSAVGKFAHWLSGCIPYFKGMNTVVLDDGKITIPQEVREALGLCPGTVLEVQSQAGTLVAWKRVEPDVFEKWRGRGRLPIGSNADDYVRLIRDGGSR